MKQLFVLMLLPAITAFAQGDGGELRIQVTDPLGMGIACNVELGSESNHYRNSFATNDDGKLTVHDLRAGNYRLHIDEPGLAPVFHGRVGLRQTALLCTKILQT